MTVYWYGMRLRPVSPGAQPKGMIDWKEPPYEYKRYHNIIAYDRKLTDEEMFVYSLDLLKVEDKLE